jgi:hypothetical protein
MPSFSRKLSLLSHPFNIVQDIEILSQSRFRDAYKWITQVNFLLLFSICLFSCKSEYQQKYDAALASGIKNDSIFGGYYFGMPDTTFFNFSRAKNLAGVFKDYRATKILNEIKLDSQNVNMYFYPEFDNQGRINKMPFGFEYADKVEYMSKYDANRLIPFVVDWFKQNYPGDYLSLTDKQGKQVYVAFHGNRRTRIYKKDLHTVVAEMSQIK